MLQLCIKKLRQKSKYPILYLMSCCQIINKIIYIPLSFTSLIVDLFGYNINRKKCDQDVSFNLAKLISLSKFTLFFTSYSISELLAKIMKPKLKSIIGTSESIFISIYLVFTTISVLTSFITYSMLDYAHFFILTFGLGFFNLDKEMVNYYIFIHFGREKIGKAYFFFSIFQRFNTAIFILVLFILIYRDLFNYIYMLLTFTNAFLVILLSFLDYNLRRDNLNLTDKYSIDEIFLNSCRNKKILKKFIKNGPVQLDTTDSSFGPYDNSSKFAQEVTPTVIEKEVTDINFSNQKYQNNNPGYNQFNDEKDDDLNGDNKIHKIETFQNNPIQTLAKTLDNPEELIDNTVNITSSNENKQTNDAKNSVDKNIIDDEYINKDKSKGENIKYNNDSNNNDSNNNNNNDNNNNNAININVNKEKELKNNPENVNNKILKNDNQKNDEKNNSVKNINNEKKSVRIKTESIKRMNNLLNIIYTINKYLDYVNLYLLIIGCYRNNCSYRVEIFKNLHEKKHYELTVLINVYSFKYIYKYYIISFFVFYTLKIFTPFIRNKILYFSVNFGIINKLELILYIIAFSSSTFLFINLILEENEFKIIDLYKLFISNFIISEMNQIAKDCFNYYLIDYLEQIKLSSLIEATNSKAKFIFIIIAFSSHLLSYFLGNVEYGLYLLFVQYFIALSFNLFLYLLGLKTGIFQ